ncbi:chitinase [Epithele typhae]|uniref:chitinase n=1 Tax=Epithele typhae TaxID=378194 RepID=UPI002008DD0C|nr:chitinase [Epithele typhae]KAH9923965.1 chitinase [Epithele typhae]
MLFPTGVFTVAAALVLTSLNSVLAASISETSLAARAVTVPSPAFVLYSDLFTPDPNILGDPSGFAGWNVINLSFLTIAKGPFDQVLRWKNLPAATKKAVKAKYHAAGIRIVAAALGDTDTPTTSGIDPTEIGQQFGQFILDNSLDGIDVDYEDLAAINKGDGKGEAWVVTFTQVLRSKLPKGQFILSHAPLAPWLAPNAQFKAGAYVTVNKKVGSLIDYYNVQFYNQPSNNYGDCKSLLYTSLAPFTGSALFQAPKHGFALNKLVIGKPAIRPTARSAGTCPPPRSASPHADSKWIKAAKGGAFA